MMKRCLALLLMLCMLCTGFAPAYAVAFDAREEAAGARQALQDYLNGYFGYSIDEIVNWFDICGNYMHSSSFKLYAQCLQAVEQDDFGMIPLWLQTMRQNQAFVKYLEEGEFQSLDDLECYIMGRQAEAEDRIEDAIDYYNACFICDSSSRSAKLQSDKYKEKYDLAMEHYRAGTYERAVIARDLFLELAELPYKDSAAMASKAEEVRRSLVTISATAKRNGNAHTITVTANSAWTITSCDPWIKPDRTSGSGGATISVLLGENPSITDPRTGHVTFSSEGKTDRVAITQPKRDYVKATVSGTGDEQTIEITANGSWKATSDSAWIKLTPLTGFADGTITAKLSEYISTHKDRTGIVTITCGSATDTVEITQRKAVKISGTATDNGSTATIRVISNGSWKASTPANWITLKNNSGTGDGTFTATLSPNPDTKNPREGTVVLSCGGKTCEVVIRQPKGIELKATCTINDKGDTATIQINASDAWTARSNYSWISVLTTSGSGKATIKASLAKNPSSTTGRTGSVTISCGDQNFKLEILQPPARVAVSSISLNTRKLDLAVNSTADLKATVYPSNASNPDVTWSSSNSTVATVSSSGMVKAKAAGSAIITAKSTDGSKTATCTVTVYSKPSIFFTSCPSSETTASTDLKITARITGGMAPYTATWTMYKDNKAENSTNGYRVTSDTVMWSFGQFNSAGSYKAGLTITDALGQTVIAKTSTMSVEAAKIQATKQADGKQWKIVVTANGSWKATTNANWIHLYGSTGTGDGTVHVTLDENKNNTSRTGMVTLTCGPARTTVSFQQDPAIAIKITNVTTESNGQATVSWTDSASSSRTYRILYLQKRSGSYENDRKAGTLLYDDGAGKTKNKFGTTTFLVPGTPYWIIIRDAKDSSITSEPYAYIPGAVSNFTEYTNRLSVGLMIKKYSLESYVSNFLVNSISSNHTYGARIQINHSRLDRKHSYRTIVAIGDPRGQTISVFADKVDYKINEDHTSLSFISFNWYFEKVTETYGSVPTGTYTISLYLNNQFAASTTFQVK